MQEPVARLQAALDQYLSGRETVRVLEAGCGSMSKVDLHGKAYVVGLDISHQQLAQNEGLAERIQGDLHTYRFAKSDFDIVICWDVLEHLDDPGKALVNLISACRRGGIVVLAFPNLFSLKGLITKFTPHVVHVWYYRYLLGVKDAGKGDTCPFPTPFRLNMNYRGIQKLARSHGASTEFFALRESPDMKYVRRQFAVVGALFNLTSWLSRSLTLGKVDLVDSDCLMILQVGEAVDLKSPHVRPVAPLSRDRALADAGGRR